MFKPLPKHLKDALLNITTKYKQGTEFEPADEEEVNINLLQRAGYLADLKFDVIGYCCAEYRYEDLNYEFLEQEYNSQKPKSSSTFINNGGAMGIGFDQSTVNITQNNGISKEDLMPYIDKIKQTIKDEVDACDREYANDSIDDICNELASGTPNEKNVKSKFKFLSKIDGSVKFASACCTLITFADKVYPFLKDCSTWFQSLIN